MLTFSFLLVIFLLTILLAVFDMMILDFSIWEALINLYFPEVATGRSFVYTGVFFGFVICIVGDFRLYKKKKLKKNHAERDGSP
ncbi:putative membrane protein [Peribacillus deserti]|uniref:Membrane protein n=1 Tax=Peribacillus deserti TaxID=673318 RepID=A0ABS2QG26_9BACI|nr:putative membrane protein [Peribacillus deserti]